MDRDQNQQKVHTLHFFHLPSSGLEIQQLYWSWINNSFSIVCFSLSGLNNEKEKFHLNQFFFVSKSKLGKTKKKNVSRPIWPYVPMKIYTAIWIGGVLLVLLYPASHPNHTSYRKLYFNEFAVNLLQMSCLSMGIIIFDLRGCGGC